MIVDRYYYNQLNKAEQAIYKAIYKGVMAHEDIIPMPVRGTLTQECFTKVFCAVTWDNPLIFHVNQSACSMAQDSFGHVAVCPQYFYSETKVKEYKRKIEGVVNPLIAQLDLLNGTDYEKVLKVHDWLCRNITYDMSGSDTAKPVNVINSHNIIGVFAHHKAQCEGIAKATKVLLNAVDIKCILAVGDAHSKKESGPHAWNIVSVDNVPYQIDVTWDIGAVDSNANHISYDYFLISDELCNKEHKTLEKLPKCDSMLQNYFEKNKLVFNSKSKLLTYITKEVLAGKREFYFRVSGKFIPQEMLQEASNCIVNCMRINGQNKIRVKSRINESIGVCWLKVL